MQNPFLTIVEAADFVVRSVLNVYVSFVLLVVGSGLASRLLARFIARSVSLEWPNLFVNIFTIAGTLVAALLAQRVLYHIPIWLR